MMSKENIKGEFAEAAMVLDKFLSDDHNLLLIDQAAEMMVSTIRSGGKILSCGNGGSMCDAMHFAEEMTGRYRENRKALAAISIGDPSHISCTSNDFGYDHVFSRYIDALGNKGDVLLGITTSGNSENIIKAIEEASKKGMKSIVLTGKDGGKVKALSDVSIIVPHYGYADRIQEMHIKIIHIFIKLIEEKLELNDC